jgi:tetratricopeptide (TPR) repeat protein
VGQSSQEGCFRASQSAQSLSNRGLRDGIATCTAALDKNLSQNDYAGTLVNRGLLEAAAHNDSAAVADFDAGLARNDKLTPAYMNRGLAMLRASRFEEARADFSRAIELGTADLHVAYFNRGEAQEGAGNLLAAYHDYRKAQELAPNFKPASLELARFQVTERRFADNR